ncbi:MAG: GldG family protein [Deltaproteobacteria bacterium]|nr:GldG family protein [Deltaproteobacteria bacterium]
MIALVAVACGERGATSPKVAVVPVGDAGGAPLMAAPPERPCGGIAKELERLRSKLRIEAYVTRGTPALDRFANDLVARLGRYREAAGGKVEVAVFESGDEAVKSRARAIGLQELDFATDPDAEPRKGFLGLAFSYENEKDAMKALSPEREGLDFWIISKIRELRERAEGVHHDIGVLTGHGEPALDAPSLVSGQPVSMQGVVTQHFPTVRFSKVDLHGGADAVPPSLEGLILLQPARDLSDAELARIDAFVMRGKALAVFASAVNVDVASKAKLDRHRLDRLLSGYGIELHEDLVLDYGQSYAAQAFTQTGPHRLVFPQILDVQEEGRRLDPTAIPFFRLPQVLFPYVSSVTVSPEKPPGATLAIVARSTARANVERGPTHDLSLTNHFAAREPFVEVGLAATAVGRLRSAFGGAAGQAPAKVFLLAASSFLANPFVVPASAPDAETRGAISGAYAQVGLTQTILAFKNTLDWMSGDDDLAACSAEVAPKKVP